MSDIKDLTQKAMYIRQKYNELNQADGHKKWDGVDYLAGFMGDMGNLAKLVMAKEGRRRGEDVDQKLSHELGDCLWSLLVLANYFDVDIEKAFNGTMEELEERLAS